ncbi:MAG: polysaccharide deacetylase family protein [Oscillospiraceae bacterium]|jgi:polysaccharide deacetylase family sporulation protein PdaB|nr:polysaccharide deacetylase family protein [Oscillospiraceae bacterium]
MFVLTLSKKRALRATLVILAVFIGAAVGIAAVFTSINTGAAETLLPIYSVDRPDNKISLTFDCAWGNSNTDELLAILEEHGVYATFFVTGEFVDKFPDDVRRIHAAGHEIANHSDAHPRIRGMNLNRLIEDTREAERKIMLVTGERPTLYRSPYGEYDENSIKTIEGLGYKFIQWSVDSIDWQEPDPATIIKRIMDKTVPGSILLFHNDLENTAQALPEVLTRLRQAGFEFVRTGELIYMEDYTIDHAGKQIREVRTIIPAGGELDAYPALTEAVEILLERLSYEEIAALRDGVAAGEGIPAAVAVRITPHLSTAQLNALSELTAAQAEAIAASILGETGTDPATGTLPEGWADMEGWDEAKDGHPEDAVPSREEELNIPNLDELLEGGQTEHNFENPAAAGDTEMPNLSELLRELEEKG